MRITHYAMFMEKCNAGNSPVGATTALVFQVPFDNDLQCRADRNLDTWKKQ